MIHSLYKLHPSRFISAPISLARVSRKQPCNGSPTDQRLAARRQISSLHPLFVRASEDLSQESASKTAVCVRIRTLSDRKSAWMLWSRVQVKGWCFFGLMIKSDDVRGAQLNQENDWMESSSPAHHIGVIIVVLYFIGVKRLKPLARRFAVCESFYTTALSFSIPVGRNI